VDLDKHTAKIIYLDDVFNLDFSDGSTLSCQELNSIVLFLATDRQT